MDEEATLKKKLETCEDFVERREIRKRLRELRQKKMEAPDPEPASQSGSRRHRKEEHTEEITTTSTDGVTVTETHTTKTEIVENGDVVKSEENVEVSSRVESVPNVEAEPEAEEEPEPEAEPENAEATPGEEEPPPQEEESENVPPYMQKNPEDLTEKDIEEIDDLDFLETTLNQLPIKFFDVRKHLRTRIRVVKVNQGANFRQGQVARSKGKMFEKQSKDDTDYKRGNPSRIAKYGKENAFLKRDETDGSRSKMETDTRLTGHFLDEKNNAEIGVCDFDNSEESCPVSQESFSIEQIASDTLLHRLDEPGLANEQEKEPEVYSEDEEASSLSSPSVASSLSDVENPSAIVSASDQSENTKKTRDDTITAHILEPLEPGKKKTDFRSQLKKTGLSPRLNLSSSGKISSLTKKEQSEKVDLRKNLKSVPGSGSFTRWGSWSEKYGPSLRERPSKRVEEEPPKRRISSAELFDLVRKRDEPKPAEEKQRKTSLPYKYEPPKIVEPEDQSFDSLMAQRKKSSSRQFSPTDLRKSPTKYAPAWSPKQLRKPTYVPPLPGAARKLSAGSIGNIGSEGSDKKDGVPDEDIDKILKEINVENLEVEETKPVSRPKRKTSSGNIKWVQGPQINIQDKTQLSALRQQIEHEKKEKEGGVSTTTTKTTEIRRDGGGTTFTKTTSTTTTRGASGGISGRGGLRNFEAEMAKKKKERQAAKAQQFKSTKDKRNAFKDQLEAANPKPAGGVKKSFSQPNTAVNALLEWCRRKTRGYENVEIQNYTTSWADGLAMCALFHNFSPDLVPWESLDPKDRKRNWTLAFDAAYAEGMDPLLELEDVLCTPVPEPRSLITYIHSIYQHFHDKAEKAKAEKQQSG